MQSRPQHVLSVAGTLVLVALPLAGLRAQSTMSKDEGSMAQPAAKAAILHGTGGHQATGTVHLSTKGDKQQLHFTPDFKTDGQDLYILLSQSKEKGSGSVQLSRLQRAAGEQTITVPAKVNASRYSYLLLWSKQDKAVIGMADLAAPGTGMEHDKMNGGMEHSTMSAGEDKMAGDKMDGDKMGSDSQPQH